MSYGFFLSAICNTATDAIKLAIRSSSINRIILILFSIIDMIISNNTINIILLSASNVILSPVLSSLYSSSPALFGLWKAFNKPG